MKIGPNFSIELEVAGLTGLPITWGPDGSVEHTGLTPGQQASLQQVIDAHDPTVIPPVDPRPLRDTLLSQSDWTQMADSPLYGNQLWLDYRQALRDVTLQPDQNNITWPIKPE